MTHASMLFIRPTHVCRCTGCVQCQCSFVCAFFQTVIIAGVPGDGGVLLSSSLWSRRYSLTDCATYVFHFLSEHSAIFRVSILGDLQNYTENGNSILTQQGFSLPLKNDISNEDKSMFVFILTAAMQVAFWGSETVKQFFC